MRSDADPPVSIVYPSRRHLSRPLQLFIAAVKGKKCGSPPERNQGACCLSMAYKIYQNGI